MKINKKVLFENCNSFVVSGIYAITNKTTGEKYIGSSKDILKRWYGHTEPSCWKQHPNSPLYLEMQKYGVENFTFTIVALVEPEHLKQVEQSAMKMLNPTYNQMYAKGWDVERKRASNKKYEQSDKGKAYRKTYMKKYRESEKGKAYMKSYIQSETGKAANKKYRESEKGKAARNAAQKKYCESEKGKANQKKQGKKYRDQICVYNGEELKLAALAKRFRRVGIERPYIEAKKYLKKY